MSGNHGRLGRFDNRTNDVRPPPTNRSTRSRVGAANTNIDGDAMDLAVDLVDKFPSDLEIAVEGVEVVELVCQKGVFFLDNLRGASLHLRNQLGVNALVTVNKLTSAPKARIVLSFSSANAFEDTMRRG